MSIMSGVGLISQINKFGKEIAGEQVKAFEHINLGNITVFDGGQNSTGNFLNNVVKTVAPALGVIDQLPIADTLKKLKGDDKK